MVDVVIYPPCVESVTLQYELCCFLLHPMYVIFLHCDIMAACAIIPSLQIITGYLDFLEVLPVSITSQPLLLFFDFSPYASQCVLTKPLTRPGVSASKCLGKNPLNYYSPYNFSYFPVRWPITFANSYRIPPYSLCYQSHTFTF